MVNCIKKQDYPAARFQTILLIDTDGPEDHSVAIGRSLGVEVYERYNAAIKTKGAALNELSNQRLRNAQFDGVLILDVDARFDSHFLARVAAYLNQGAMVVQTELVSKNPDENALTHVGDATQALLRVMERGRATAKFPVMLLGLGMAFSKQSFERLEWKLANSHLITEDRALNLQCVLKNIPIVYAPDIKLSLEMVQETHMLRRQRRRWIGGALEIVHLYVSPLLRKSYSGDLMAFKAIFSLLFRPGFSVVFCLWGLMVFLMSLFSIFHRHLMGWTFLMAALWLFHGLYYLVALRTQGFTLAWRDAKALSVFFSIQVIALFEGIILACRFRSGTRWVPTPHKKDS